ncbi:MAG: hypothetical protein U0N84_03450 [Terrisporobacter sp.]|uniref:hypothetical protein n=1 Tax=Terrisporobacter sp. TaxID=1965305 RepID=UPI002F92816C
MKKIKTINFLKEEKKEEKYFKCILVILLYLLIFQCYNNIQSIKNLKEEIKNSKPLIQYKHLVNNEIEKSTLIKDTSKVYKLLGFKNVDRLVIENNKVKVEGRCKDLDILEDLKSMDNIKNFSITNVEYKNKKYYFNATYEIGGTK